MKLVKDAGSEGIFVKTDVTNEDDIRSLVERSTKKFGRLDYAFNNAGIEESMTPLVDQRSDIFDQIINVNVKGVWLSMKYEIPEMIKSGGGVYCKYVFCSRCNGISSNAYLYRKQTCCTWIDESAGSEYARSGIRINAVAPGAVNTDMAKRVVEGNPQLSQTLTSMHPIGHTAEPEEIADVVSWLLSDKSTLSWVIRYWLMEGSLADNELVLLEISISLRNREQISDDVG